MITLQSQAAGLPGPISARVVRVIDGDTIEVQAFIWPGHSVETRVRLADVDTPELRRPDCPVERVIAQAALDHVEQALPVGAPVMLRQVTLGSFAGRVIAALELETGESLGDRLMAAKLAQPYGQSDFCRVTVQPGVATGDSPEPRAKTSPAR